MISKIGCPWCDEAEALFKLVGIKFTKEVLDPEHDGYEERRDEVFNKYEHYSFPIITCHGELVGGFTDLAFLPEFRLDDF